MARKIPISFISLLKEIKWNFYSIKLVFLYLFGRIIVLQRRRRKCVILTGEVNYTGGTFAYFLSLIEFLLKQEYIVSVVVSRRFGKEAIGKIAGMKKVRLLVIPKSLALIEFMFLFWAALRSGAACIVSSASGPGAYTQTMLLNIPTIHLFHSSPGATTGKRERRLVSWFFKEPHRIIALSRFNRQAVVKVFGLRSGVRERVVLVYNGVQDIFKEPARRPLDGDFVVTIGHVVGYKNPETWLETARYVLQRTRKKVAFIWAGDGPDIDTYREKAKEFSNIHFIGFEADVSSLLNKASIYYHPSTIENCSLAIQEAMSAGLACVVSNSGGSPELVLDGRNGFVLDSNDIHGHGSAILHLLADDELRSRMAKESRILYLEKFSHEKWQSKMTKLLSETCGLVSGVGKTRGHSI